MSVSDDDELTIMDETSTTVAAVELTQEGEPRWMHYLKRPIKAVRLYGFTMKRVLGWRFFCFLLFSQLLGKGLLYQLTRGFTLPLFKSVLHVDASTLQIYIMIILMPWSLKPLIGLCADFILIGGYRKRGWLLIGASIGVLCSALLLAIRPSTPFIIVLLLMGINLQVSLYDLLSEAKYSEVRNEFPEVGSDISTLVQGMQTIGALAAFGCVGALSDSGLYTVLYLITFILCVSPVAATLLGWLPETSESFYPVVRFAVSRDELKEDLPLILVVAFCGCSGIVSDIIVLGSPLAGLIVATLLLVASLAGCWAVFPPGITQVALYQVLTTLSRPALGSALDYFYTATPACVPDGPHFSYIYYVSIAGLLGTLLSLLGVFIYQLLFSRLKFRVVLLVTTLFVVLGALSDLFIVTRTNIAWGVSDTTAYILGEAVLEPLLGMLNWIPVSALIAMAVPKGKEASAFSFMAGISNFSAMVSELSGALVFQAAGIVTSEASGCNFDALPSLIVMCYIVIPLMVGIPSIFLIPNIQQTGAL